MVFLHGLVDTEHSWFRTDWFGRPRSGSDLGSKLASALPSPRSTCATTPVVTSPATAVNWLTCLTSY